MKDFANVASIGSIIPGPIGMISAGVSAAAYAKAGDKKQALLMASSVALAAVGAGGAVKAYQLSKTTKLAPFAKNGVNSKLFGSGASYKKIGTVNKGLFNKNNMLRIGWTKSQGSHIFGIAVGPTTKYASSTKKWNPVRYVPHRHIYERRWGWR